MIARKEVWYLADETVVLRSVSTDVCDTQAVTGRRIQLFFGALWPASSISQLESRHSKLYATAKKKKKQKKTKNKNKKQKKNKQKTKKELYATAKKSWQAPAKAILNFLLPFASQKCLCLMFLIRKKL